MKVAGINQEYFKLVLENDSETRNKYNTFLQLKETFNNDYLFCNSCKIRKRSDLFKKFGVEKTPAKVCKTCINEREKERKYSHLSLKKCGEDFKVDLSENKNYIFCKKHREI